jgi:hypothetical protein
MTIARKETKVFIAGSRRLSKLSQDVKLRIDKVVEQNLTILIGDASGADKAVQQYLSSKGYGEVVVFCMDGSCRNNLGNWTTQEIKAVDSRKRDFAYYSTKDRAMAREADYGLMLWDGESRGTLTNIVQLVREAKPVVVFVAPENTFYTLRDPSDLSKVSVRVAHADFDQIERDLQSADSRRGANRKSASVQPVF